MIQRHGGEDVDRRSPDDDARRAVPADRARERAAPGPPQGGQRFGPARTAGPGRTGGSPASRDRSPRRA